jgi:hypothetical protein
MRRLRRASVSAGHQGHGRWLIAEVAGNGPFPATGYGELTAFTGLPQQLFGPGCFENAAGCLI